MKTPCSRADGVSDYSGNVYYIAAGCGELDPKKVVCVGPCGACRGDLSRRSFNEGGSLARRRVCGKLKDEANYRTVVMI